MPCAIPLQRVRNSHQAPQKLLVLRLMVYVYDEHADIFKPLPDMPKDLPEQMLTAIEALRDIATGLCAHMHFLHLHDKVGCGLTQEDVLNYCGQLFT